MNNTVRTSETTTAPFSFLPSQNSQTRTAKRFLCLRFPNWPIQRLIVAQPELRRQRIVLFRRDSRRGQIVSAASPLAMRGGVCVGMPLSEAKSLLRYGESFYVFEHNFDHDLKALETFADSFDSFSPIVGLETIEPAEFKRGRRPDSLLLEVTGVAHLFGDESQLAWQLVQHCDTQGYLPRIAIADTVGAAWSSARFVAQHRIGQREAIILPPGEQQAIQQLPVDALRLPEDTTDTLYQLGLKTIGQLQQLSRSDLAMRFGNLIHRRMDQLTGRLAEPVIARRKPAEFIGQKALEHPTHHRETIEVIIARLVTDLCKQMRVRQQGALEWLIKMDCQSGPPIQFQVNLFQPTSTTQEVMPLIEMQLEQALSPVTRKYRKKHPLKKRKSNSNGKAPIQTETAPPENRFLRLTTVQVQEIEVSVTSSVLMAQQQRQLFDENPQLNRQSLAHLINRLTSRLGVQNVLYPLMQSGAQPEHSFRLKPLADANRKQKRRTMTPGPNSHTLARPLRLFRTPIALKPMRLPTTTGTSQPQPPNQLPEDRSTLVAVDPHNKKFARARTVIATCGPERIETGWWRGRTVCRDYWRVETNTQQQYWVYRDLRNGNWFLHGEF